MSLTTPPATFNQPSEGTHEAVCVQLIDLGIQVIRWKEEPEKQQHKILIGWEITDEENDEGEPHITWKRYTMTLHEKGNLRSHLESWRGKRFTSDELKGFDLRNVLGAPCLLSLVENESGYVNIEAIAAWPKRKRKPKATRDMIAFDFENFDEEIFATFSEKLQDLISSAVNFPRNGEMRTPDDPPTPEEEDDDCPF